MLWNKAHDFVYSIDENIIDYIMWWTAQTWMKIQRNLAKQIQTYEEIIAFSRLKNNAEKQ